MDYLELWKHLASRVMCRYYNCQTCKSILKMNDCLTLRADQYQDEIVAVIVKVTNKLIEAKGSRDKLDEEEFISVIEDSFS